MGVYDVNGNSLLDYPHNTEGFMDNIDVDYEFDATTNVNYTVIRVYKTRIDGTKQYPFVYAPNGTGQSTKSTLDMAKTDGWYLAINGGVFSTSQWMGTADAPNKPLGLLIQNGVALQSGYAYSVSNLRKPLTIDSNGDLSYTDNDPDAPSLISDGIISAVCGFGAIIDNFVAVDYSYIPDGTNNHQRQIIGQFGNGDYAIVTCEGRSNNHSDGWTMDEAVSICQKIGLKFAYVLDGGGSTETVIGQKQLNTIYENTTGRIVPTFIVFNGTDTFGVPQ